MSLQEVEQLINDTFKELFYENFLWLIIISILTFIVLILYLFFHLRNSSKKTQDIDKQMEYFKTAISNLSRKITYLESKSYNMRERPSANSTNSNDMNLKDIAKQLDELKAFLTNKE